eukprot:TRINITY_DN1780_c0_g1_i2.p1 TRINITY_DN1780_c0_g1~~TRINITY_DN1780_c0_g1_i2.p1  ORF type:complete len:251 (-),score=45.67 TRINITY_DN1780_c0_g1_i2:42-794(-)
MATVLSLHQIQALSGVAFSTFSSVHIITAISANFGPETYERVLRFFRIYYQHPLIEVTVVGASLVTHVVSSSIIASRRESKKTATNSPQKFKWLSPLGLHRLSGYYLNLSMVGHIVATRLRGYLFASPADFAFISLTLARWPLAGFFYPYYALLAISGVYHTAYGLASAKRTLTHKGPKWFKPGSTSFKVAVGTGCVAILSSILAFGGWYFPLPEASKMAAFMASERGLLNLFLGERFTNSYVMQYLTGI